MPRPEVQRSSLPETLGLVVLVAALGATMVVRVATRRPDDARTPRQADVLVLHLAGLRADAAVPEEFTADLGCDPAAAAVFVHAFAQSTDPARSARSALLGDLARDLEGPLGDDSLVARLRGAGFETRLVTDDARLAAQLGSSFESTERVDAAAAAAALSAAWPRGDAAPAFVFVHLAFGAEPLHSDTTEAYVLKERHRLRVRRLREAIAALARAARPTRPQYVVLLGGNGLPLGEHPARGDGEAPFDAQLRVPFILALRGGDGLPGLRDGELVQSADLAPTLLDLLDIVGPSPAGTPGAGVSLEARIQGWQSTPPHDAIFLLAPQHLAVRTADWKLIAPLRPPLRPERAGARLYSLREDPAETFDLLASRTPGPVADALWERLEGAFGQP
jgi:hypothetical protein